LGAAAELDLFTLLAQQPGSSEQLAQRLGSDHRATTMLLDALVALKLLAKEDQTYSVPEESRPFLVEDSDQSTLPMVRHRMNILRGWAQLAGVTMTGVPGPRQASIRGPEGDRESFLAAMHTVSGPMADDLVARLGPPKFKHLLDVGCASGTWSMAFLRAVPDGRATLFDLPDGIEQARQRIDHTDVDNRTALVAGDFYKDDLPGRVDLAWVSAIVHQHSRAENVKLFKKVHTALVSGGRIAIRDVVMEPCHTRPVGGALFAINMLVNTKTGTTFTFEELAKDLATAGFVEPQLAIQDQHMNNVVMATKG
jgi:SAM-dependent methyltransferase